MFHSGSMQQKHKLPAVKTPTFFDVSHHEGDCNRSATSSLSSLLNERFCRICHEPDKNNDLLSHCQCKGSVGLAHTSCLIYWIKKSGSVTCELCKHKYVTVTQINKRFWQWKLPRVGAKGWFKLIFFAGFLCMFIAFTSWIVWSRVSSSAAAEQERGKKQVKYSYIIYGMLVLIAIVGMYAVNVRAFVNFISRCLVINKTIMVIPNGDLCEETTSSTESLDECDRDKSAQITKHSPCKHDLPLLRDTCVQLQFVEDTTFSVQGYTKRAGQNEVNMV